MLLAVDSNVLFTFFWNTSVFRKLSLRQDLLLVSPEFALEEIDNNSSELAKKAGVSKEEFGNLLKELKSLVRFVPIEEYSPFLKDADSLAKSLLGEEKAEFLKDVDFIALALKLKCPLWSNDRLLKKQSKVEVFSTKEVIGIIPKDE